MKSTFGKNSGTYGTYGTYNPQKSMISNHLSSLCKKIDKFSSNYENIIIIEDFNSEISEVKMSGFCGLYNFKNLVKDPTCYKKPQIPSCIDLNMTNKPNTFQNTNVKETGLPDFNKLKVSVLKTFFKKVPLKIIFYGNYKNYFPIRFRAELEKSLHNYGINNLSNDDFVYIFMNILNNHVPIKHKHVSASDNPFVTNFFLDEKKAIPKDSIPPKIIKGNCDIFAHTLLVDFNTSVDYGLFPNNLEYADVSPALMKGDRLDKK